MTQIRLNVILEDNTYNQLKTLAEKEGRTISGLIRLLINEYMSKVTQAKTDSTHPQNMELHKVE